MIDGKLALSICIPTYNRLAYLKESLKILLPEAQKYGVQVCVSDNHSADETANYLKQISEEYSCLNYFIQAENIGLDRNMMTVISMGEGAYVYPLGDDDFLPAESLPLILNAIGGNADILILNGWHTNPVLLPMRMHLPKIIKPIIFSTPESAFNSLWDKMPFGSFLATRECFLRKNFIRHLGTSHAYTGAVWDALAEKYNTSAVCKVECMVHPTVMLRGAEKSWRNDAALIMLYEIPKWFSLIMEIKEYQAVVQPIRSIYLKQQTSFSMLLRYRSMGQLERVMVDRLGLECSREQRQKIKMVASVPRFVVNFLSRLRSLAVKVIRPLLKK